MAGRLGISQVYADCLPEDKLKRIEEYQKTGKKICMIGDGINDAPALKKAFVGIAMGGIGSDIAVDAADIALINDKISELPHLLRLAKRMMITIKCNLTFSMTLNFVAIVPCHHRDPGSGSGSPGPQRRIGDCDRKFCFPAELEDQERMTPRAEMLYRLIPLSVL